MHWLLKRYIDAKYNYFNEQCACPQCETLVLKKSQNHIFCKLSCKDLFWLQVKGRDARTLKINRNTPKGKLRGFSKNRNNGKIQSRYPGGYEQWKKDLEKEEGNIAVDILLSESDDI